MEFNEFFVQGMALLGAGIAMVAGLVKVSVKALRLVKVPKL